MWGRPRPARAFSHLKREIMLPTLKLNTLQLGKRTVKGFDLSLATRVRDLRVKIVL